MHINRPAFCLHRTILHCRTCRRKRRVVFRHYMWYDSLCTCTQCGTDPRAPRKSKLWGPDRKKAARAKQEYKTAGNWRQVKQWMREEWKAHQELAVEQT